MESPLNEPMVFALFKAHRERAPKELIARLLPVVIEAPKPEGEVIRVDFPVTGYYPIFRHHPTVEDVLIVVGRFYQVSVDELKSKSRRARVVWPRQVAMHLAMLTTGKSLVAVGQGIGGRDHTTIIWAKKKVAREAERDERFADEITLLRMKIAQRLAARNGAAA